MLLKEIEMVKLLQGYIVYLFQWNVYYIFLKDLIKKKYLHKNQLKNKIHTSINDPKPAAFTKYYTKGTDW